MDISPEEYYRWIKYVFEHEDEFILPTKTRAPLRESDYFNVMPCVLPNDNFMGLKVVTRNQLRRELYNINLDAQILLYSYDTEELLAIMDGNIGTAVGDIFFELTKDRKYIVKLFRYHGDEEIFIKRFSKYKNIEFVVCDTYEELMSESDLIFSSVSYIANDFVPPKFV